MSLEPVPGHDEFGDHNSLSLQNTRALLNRYVTYLDSGRISEWPNFFNTTGIYRITTRRNREKGYPLSIMYCEGQAMLFDRVEAIERANLFEPHYYRHILSDSSVLKSDENSFTFSTSFLCVRTMMDGRSAMFAGEYIDQVVSEGGELRFVQKTVVLELSQIDVMIVIPL